MKVRLSILVSSVALLGVFAFAQGCSVRADEEPSTADSQEFKECQKPDNDTACRTSAEGEVTPAHYKRAGWWVYTGEDRCSKEVAPPKSGTQYILREESPTQQLLWKYADVIAQAIVTDKPERGSVHINLGTGDGKEMGYVTGETGFPTSYGVDVRDSLKEKIEYKLKEKGYKKAFNIDYEINPVKEAGYGHVYYYLLNQA